MPPGLSALRFPTNSGDFSNAVLSNIQLICGDPLLELQSNAINILANNQIPGTDTWIAVVSWPQSDQVTSPQLAVDRQVEQGEVPDPLLALEVKTHGPDLFRL